MSDGWFPEAERQPSPNHEARNAPIKAACLHIMQGGLQGSIDYMNSKGLSAHFCVGKNGRIVQMVSIKETAYTNGLTWDSVNKRWLTPSDPPRPVTPAWPEITPGLNPNRNTVTIEHEGFTGQPLTAEMQAADRKLLKWIASETGLVYVAGHTLIGHRHINPLDKARCPGTAFDLAAIALDANTAATPPSRYFPQTNQWMGNAFLLYWEALERIPMPNGGGNVAVALLGYPHKPEQQATIGDWTGTVQYLQKARLEWHPENPEGSKVLTGLLGVEAAK
jgi:hypothetical protein